jgi:single-stranded DNA-binding protein
VIDALIAGRLYGTPCSRVSRVGRTFATAKVRVATSNGESAFISVVAFSDHAIAALLALSDGDSVALAGALTASAFTDKEGTARPSLDLVAHQVLTAYHVGRKRKAMQPSDGTQARDESSPAADERAADPAETHEELSDAIPF